MNSMLNCIRCIPVATVSTFPKKVVLHAPPQHSPTRCEVPKSLLKSHPKLWQSQDGITNLWWEIEGVPTHPPANSEVPPASDARSLHWARLDRLGNAIKVLSSSGEANLEDSSVQAEILKRHQILIFLTYHLPSLLRLS